MEQLETDVIGVTKNVLNFLLPKGSALYACRGLPKIWFWEIGLGDARKRSSSSFCTD